MKTQLLSAVVAIALVLGASACVRDEAPRGPEVAVSVAALDLPGVSNAVYTLEVQNGSDEVVWTRTIDSDGYGDGAGSASYVGPCDADDNDNTVLLTLDELWANGVQLTADQFKNPGTLQRDFECVPNADVAVTFDLTIIRPANQGFFDIAVTFDNIFCSAKLDCKGSDNQPIMLLHDADGARATTLVMGFACTTGNTSDITILYRDDIEITCGGNTVTVDPDGAGNLPAGNITGQTGILFGAQVSRGKELFAFDKQYWNVMLGLVDTEGVYPANCTLSSAATAARGYFTANSTPDGTSYPYILWDDIVLTDGSGALQCSQHAVDDTPVGVSTEYVPLATPYTFDHEWSTHIPIVGQGIPGAPRAWADGTEAESCLGYFSPDADSDYTYVGSTGDGVYLIDPDGEGGAAPYEATCDMTNGGWTRVALNTFEDQSHNLGDPLNPDSGWSWAVTPGTCGAYGSIMWTSNGYTEKRFTWPAVPHTDVRLDVDYIVIDSWDPWTGSFDAGYVNLGDDADFGPEPPDGLYVQVVTGGSNALNDPPDGTQTVLDGTWSNQCGGGGDENSVHVTLTLPGHADDYAWVRGSSTLGSSFGGDPTEEWGLDNVAIWVK